MFAMPASTMPGLLGAAITIAACLALQLGPLRGQGYHYAGLNALHEIRRHLEAALPGHRVDKPVRSNRDRARSHDHPEYHTILGLSTRKCSRCCSRAY